MIPAAEPEVGSGADPVSSARISRVPWDVQIYSPLSNLRTSESGDPSASIRRGFFISMLGCCWSLTKIAELLGGAASNS